MKKILLLDPSVSTINLGDEIIQHSIRKFFPELFENNYIFTLPTHTKTFTWYQKLLYKNRMKLYHTADVKFLCGTNALYSNMLRPMPTWNINILDHDLYDGTVLLGVGIGVNSQKTNRYTKYLYNKVLSHKYVHSCRDEKTKKFLEELGFKAENTGCPTTWGLTSEFCSEIPHKKAERCVFTLTSYHTDIDNDRLMLDIISKNYDQLYFWPQSIDDLSYLHALKDNLNIEVIAPNVHSYDLLLSSGNIDYIGNRLHGGIFALQHQVRTIIIGIDYRAKEMHETYSFPYIDRENMSQLDEKILTEWPTKINGIDFEVIDKWKRQF